MKLFSKNHDRSYPSAFGKKFLTIFGSIVDFVGGKQSKVSRFVLFRWAFWFLIANAFVMMLIAARYLETMGFPDGFLARFFLLITYPGHFTTLALAALPIIGISILIYPRRTFVVGISMVVGLLILIVLFIDSVVFSQFRFHLNGMVWNLITGGAAAEILPISWFTWFLFGGFVLVLLLAELVIAFLIWKGVSQKRRMYGPMVVSVLFILILGGQGLHAWADATNEIRITRQARYYPLFFPLRMEGFLAEHGFLPGEREKPVRLVEEKSGLKYPHERLLCQSEASPNLIIIAIDSWRFDTLSPEITPNIWRFSRDGWRFNHHFSAGNSTRFGIFGLFYGIYGTYWYSFLAEEQGPVLIRELRDRDYRMGVFSSAPLSSPEFDRTVFSKVRDQISFRQEGKRPSERDRAITEKMLAFLDSQDDTAPFFGFLFYDSPHATEYQLEQVPFEPSWKTLNYLALDNDFDPLPYFNRYKNSLFYVDMLVGEIFTKLEEKQLLENTVVILTSDHGKEFNELKLNYWGHNGNFARYQTQVPLVVRWPGKSPADFSHTTSHLDIAPTLMTSMFGCQSAPSAYSNGRLLLDTEKRPYVLVSSWKHFAVVEPDRINHVTKTGSVEIFDNHYRDLPEATLRPRVVSSVLKEMGGFYR